MARLFSIFIAALLFGCGGTSVTSGGILTLTAGAQTAAADGTWVTLSISAKDGSGAPGTGRVDLDGTNVQFYGFERLKDATAILDKGAGSIKVACFQVEDPLCVGGQVVHATWNGVDAYASVQFTQAP